MEKNVDQVYWEIAKTLWSLCSENADAVHFYAQIFKDYSGFSIALETQDGIHTLAAAAMPNEALDLLNLLAELQTMPPFSLQSAKWTHCHLSLNRRGQFVMRCGYIDQADSWFGIFMKGISDLTYQEARQYGVDGDLWHKRVMQYGKSHL